MLTNLNTLSQRKKAVLALCLVLPAPLVGILSSLYLPQQVGDLQIGQVIWFVLKVWMVALPVLWLLYLENGKLSWSPTSMKGVLEGLLWSIPISILLLVTYWVAKGGSFIDPEARQTIEALAWRRLDPRARIEIRELLKELHRMGKTILISSHILHELAELCTSVGIIEQGKLLFSGKVDAILEKAKVGQVVHIEVTERAEDAATLLRSVDGINCVDVVTENGSSRIDVTIDATTKLEVSELPNRLIAQGFRITSMQGEQVNLETAFMRLTKGLVG